MFRLILPLVLASASWAAHAQIPDAPHVLTLAQAQALALQSNPQLAAAAHELQATEGAAQQAAMRPNPMLSVEVQDTRRATRETTLALSQPIELGGKRAYRAMVAERAREGAALLLQARRNDIRAEVSKAFYALLIAEERLKLANESAMNAGRATMTATRRVQAGKISPVDADKARIVEATVRLDLLQAQAEVHNARLQLAALWGERRADSARIAGSLEQIPVFASLPLLTVRLATSPALLAARAGVERQRAAARLEQSRRVGDLSVSLGIKRSEELGRNQAIIGLSVPLPLFDRNQGAILETLRRSDKAQDEFDAAALQLNVELAQAHAKFEVAREQVIAIREDVLPRATRALDAAHTGFEFGKFALLDVLDAQRTLLQTRSQYLAALGELHRTAADIERLAAINEVVERVNP